MNFVFRHAPISPGGRLKGDSVGLITIYARSTARKSLLGTMSKVLRP